MALLARSDMPYPYFDRLSGYQPAPAPMTYGTQTGYGSQAQPVHGFIYVTGLEGAKAFQMPPNSEMPLFDSTGDILYIKTTDGAGFPTITICDCKRRGSSTGDGTQDYVTRDELERMRQDMTAQIAQMREAFDGTVPTGAEPATGASATAQAGGGR